MTRRKGKGWSRTNGKCWVYSAGGKGSKVTVREREPGGMLQACAWDPVQRKYIRVTLGYKLDSDSSWKRAEAYALKQAAKLREGVNDIAQARTTLQRLFRAYIVRRGDLSRHDQSERLAEMWQRVLGPNKDPHKATEDEMARFTEQRLSGAIDAWGNRVPEEKRRVVRQRTPHFDIEWLKHVLLWGYQKARDPNGNFYLREHPLRGYTPKKEVSPRRPVADQDRYERVQAEVHMVMMYPIWCGKKHELPCYLGDVLLIAHEHGRRIGAVRKLTYTDLHFERTKECPYGAVAWPEQTDKKGKRWLTAMTPDLREMFERIVEERMNWFLEGKFGGLSEAPGGSDPLFPSTRDPKKPIDYATVSRWLSKAEALAKLEPLEGGKFHPYRRMWASDRKHLPDVDVAQAGGWSDLRALKTAYQHPDYETQLEVLMVHRDRKGGQE